MEDQYIKQTCLLFIIILKILIKVKKELFLKLKTNNIVALADLKDTIGEII